jgi:hypothetical protein
LEQKISQKFWSKNFRRNFGAAMLAETFSRNFGSAILAETLEQQLLQKL